MQNISYVFSLLGRQWVPGLKPARNVGSTIAGKIEAIIAELEGQKQPATALFKVQVREKRSRLKGKSPPPKGAKQPKTVDVVVTQHVRDPAVRAWVLNQAAGTCECCQLPAPFETVDGPFLEVHHVRLLADNGSYDLQRRRSVSQLPPQTALWIGCGRSDRPDVYTSSTPSPRVELRTNAGWRELSL